MSCSEFGKILAAYPALHSNQIIVVALAQQEGLCYQFGLRYLPNDDTPQGFGDE